jgi:protein-S-isoprenylcysteine O-methyltransferase Ste14
MQTTTTEPARESNTHLALRAIMRVAALVGLCVWGGLSGWWQLWLFLGLVARTHFEDHALKDELEGYRDYAARTRHRLLPGVW